MPMFAAYGASKAALSVFSKVMRMELSAWGVKVALIQPAGFRTSRSAFKLVLTTSCCATELNQRL